MSLIIFPNHRMYNTMNGRRWVQCMFIFDNKGTILVSDVDNGGDYVCVLRMQVYENFVAPSQCGKSKTVSKNKIFFIF